MGSVDDPVYVAINPDGVFIIDMDDVVSTDLVSPQTRSVSNRALTTTQLSSECLLRVHYECIPLIAVYLSTQPAELSCSDHLLLLKGTYVYVIS